MIIDKSRTYRTRDGREVRIYSTDNAYRMVHGAVLYANGWQSKEWNFEGKFSYEDGDFRPLDLIPADPHGILPRHRELLASVYESIGSRDGVTLFNGGCFRSGDFDGLSALAQAALIALAKLDAERSVTGSLGS